MTDSRSEPECEVLGERLSRIESPWRGDPEQPRTVPSPLTLA